MCIRDRLRAARREPHESFSKVIKRATWAAPEKSCGALLMALRDIAPLDDDTLAALEQAQHADAPPEPKWRE